MSNSYSKRRVRDFAHRSLGLAYGKATIGFVDVVKD